MQLTEPPLEPVDMQWIRTETKGTWSEESRFPCQKVNSQSQWQMSTVTWRIQWRSRMASFDLNSIGSKCCSCCMLVGMPSISQPVSNSCISASMKHSIQGREDAGPLRPEVPLLIRITSSPLHDSVHPFLNSQLHSSLKPKPGAQSPTRNP
jgi:hypothetical protein